MDIKETFKKYKKCLTVVCSAIFVLYAVFLFVLPNVININSFKSDIQKIVKDIAKLDINFDSAKIVTTPTLKAGLNIKGLSVSYPSGKEITSLKEAEAKISLLPLILMTVQVSDIAADTPVVNLELLKDGQLDILDYVNKNILAQGTESQAQTTELPVKISDKMPIVKVKDLAVNIKDQKSGNTVSLIGNNFILDDTVLNKHLRITTDGKVLLNNKDNVNFNVKVKSFFPVISSSAEPQTEQPLPEIDIFKELVKYDPKVDVIADLIINEHNGQIGVNGYLNADKISVRLDGNKLPDSFFHIKSTGNETVINSDLCITSQEKAQLYSKISHGRKLKLDINFKTDKISFVSIRDFAYALLNSFDIKNDLNAFNTQGVIKADFTVKTDLKKFESSGYFNIADGAISHKLVPVNINGIAADIDFDDNRLDINNVQTVINGTKVVASGMIDSKANADITVKSGDINLAPLFNAFAPAELKNMYQLSSGIFSIDVVVKGRLDKIKPTLDAGLRQFLLKTKYPMPSVSLSVKDASVNVTPENITIVPFSVFINSSKINVSGGVKDYLNNMKIAVNADGSLLANDLKNMLPKEARGVIGANGSIPVDAKITGNAKKIDIAVQAYTNGANHFSPISVKKMVGKSGLVNFYGTYSGDSFVIEDAALYQSAKTSFDSDFAANKKSAQKIAGVTGSVSSLSVRPYAKLNISIPEQLLLSSPVMSDASLKARGDINIAGDLSNINNLSYRGFVSVKDIALPDFLIKVQDADVELNGNTASAQIQNLDINGTALNINAEASTKLGNVFLIKSMNVTSLEFDVDKLFKAMDKMNAVMASAGTPAVPVNSSAPVLPVKINNGDINIQKFVMKQLGGNLEASNITGDFTLVNDLFKLDNLKLNTFGGNVNGEVTYNIKTTAVTANVKGSKLNANPAVTVFVGLKDQLMGNVDFNADVRLKGATYEQQMKTLNGKVDFSVKDGQLGSLGSFETFLKADNLLTQSFVSTKVGSLVSSVAPYKTGKFTYLDGVIDLKNGVAKLNPVKMSGTHMAMLINGDVNILSMDSNLNVLGSLSPEVTGVLGPVADLSVEKFAAYIPKFGAKIASALNTYNAAANKAELEKIPAMTPAKDNTQSFKVVINGNLNNPAGAVKKFQWLNTPEKIKEEQAALTEAVTPKPTITKEEIKQQVKEDLKQGVTNALKNNEKVQQIQKNQTVKNLSDIYNFYKKSGAKSNTSTPVEAQE